MGPIPVYLPGDLEADLETYRKRKDSSARRPFGGCWKRRQNRALRLLEDDEVTFSRAAELAKLDV